MPYPSSQYPDQVWDGTTPNSERVYGRVQRLDPNPDDWDQIVAEVIATQTKLDAVEVTGGESAAPAGALMPYAGSVAPAGWLLADGAEVSRITYVDLFAVIGTVYGIGDGSTTFNLPSLVDKSPLGVGVKSLGDSGGALDHVHAGPSHVHAGPSHQHTFSEVASGNTDPDGSHTHTYNTVIQHNHPLSSDIAYIHTMEDPWTAGFGVLQHSAATYRAILDGSGTEDAIVFNNNNGIGSFNIEDTHTHTVSDTGSASGTTAAPSPSTHTHTFSDTVSGSTSLDGTGDTDAGGTEDTASANAPYLALNYIIKY